MDGWFSRAKDIYYDTDGIAESQIESVCLCDNCRGVMQIETWSTANPLSCCLEIPQTSCPKCRDIGYDLYAKAKRNANYRYIKLINRLDKEYLQSGF